MAKKNAVAPTVSQNEITESVRPELEALSSSHVFAGSRGGARTRELIEKGKLYEELERRQEEEAHPPAAKTAAKVVHHVVEHAPPAIPQPGRVRPVKLPPKAATHAVPVKPVRSNGAQR